MEKEAKGTEETEPEVYAGRAGEGKEREGGRNANERAKEGVGADKRERKYERSRVKRTNKQASAARLGGAAGYDGGRGRKRERRWTDGSRRR